MLGGDSGAKKEGLGLRSREQWLIIRIMLLCGWWGTRINGDGCAHSPSLQVEQAQHKGEEPTREPVQSHVIRTVNDQHGRPVADLVAGHVDVHSEGLHVAHPNADAPPDDGDEHEVDGLVDGVLVVAAVEGEFLLEVSVEALGEGWSVLGGSDKG